MEVGNKASEKYKNHRGPPRERIGLESNSGLKMRSVTSIQVM